MYQSILLYEFPPPGLNYFGHYRLDSAAPGKRPLDHVQVQVQREHFFNYGGNQQQVSAMFYF